MTTAVRLDIEAIRAASPIEEVVTEHVRLHSRGAQLFGLCPFHEERTPSFAVHPGKQAYHCHGCHAGGDVFGFIMRLHGCDFRDAADYLARRAGLDAELAPDDRARVHAAEAQRKKARAAAELFDEWRNTCHRILADRYYELGQSAERAREVLAHFRDCEPAWEGLARFYHREAELSAALDLLCFEKCSRWLEEPMTREGLTAAFRGAYAAVRGDLDAAS